MSSFAATLYVTVAYAVEPSWLTAWAWNGSTAFVTCEPSASSATACSIASLFSVAVTFSPLGATNTTRAVAPSAVTPGKRSSSRSNAFWDSMPGMENSSSEAPGALRAPKPTAPTRY
ncbi:hypothetical protein GCM10017771_92020 [Streptomyces capitiformicae]|uniref:Uncharacterized protein n=1 Tax=Streptomyces capitiformicae TaxID=2014920 RepID=A0A918ZU59_9ACTN|nr:hypothetical protein GCM10017771_92020 [Streptomyces capitiformicae]